MATKAITSINDMTMRCIRMELENGDFELHELVPENIFEIKIDKIKLSLINNNFLTTYEEDVTKPYLDIWRNGVGGVVRKDFSKKDISKYYEFITSGTKTILRKVDNDAEPELLLKFGEDNFIKIGDFYFLPIKTVEKKSNYSQLGYSFSNQIELPKEEKEQELGKKGKKGKKLEDNEEELDTSETLTQSDIDLLKYYIPEND